MSTLLYLYFFLFFARFLVQDGLNLNVQLLVVEAKRLIFYGGAC